LGEPTGPLRPVVVQDRRSGQVLMVAYADEEALRRTRETGLAHFFSRSRQALWRKGDTSGHFLRVRQVLVDCDGDALLYVVDPTGPACHTGEVSCFHRDPAGQRETAAGGVLAELEEVVRDRIRNAPAGSYTAALVSSDPARLHEKLFEEVAEVVRAAREEGPQRLAEEAADFVYHLLVLLARHGVRWSEVLDVLDARRTRR
jgi:phosphoribosyl-ATP pyrophosphohydrolase/phosphoribosyl-AMP cyclohydrolase